MQVSIQPQKNDCTLTVLIAGAMVIQLLLGWTPPAYAAAPSPLPAPDAERTVADEESETEDEVQTAGADGWTLSFLALAIPLTCAGVACAGQVLPSSLQETGDDAEFYDETLAPGWRTEHAGARTAIGVGCCALPMLLGNFSGAVGCAAVFGNSIDWWAALWAAAAGTATLTGTFVAGGAAAVATLLIVYSQIGSKESAASNATNAFVGYSLGTLGVVATVASSGIALGTYWALAEGDAEQEPQTRQGRTSRAAATESRAPTSDKERLAPAMAAVGF